MQITGLDGIEYKWKYYAYQKQKDNASGPHKRARKLLLELYPFSTICEEIPLVGTFSEKLIIDLYLHTQRLAVEVQGIQHFKHTFFHPDKRSFGKAQARDRSKVEWCKLNNIDLVALPDSENNEQWEKRIRQRS